MKRKLQLGVQDNKKIYYFKASDIGKALNLTNIRASIQNYDEDEQVVRKAYEVANKCIYISVIMTQN